MVIIPLRELRGSAWVGSDVVDFTVTFPQKMEPVPALERVIEELQRTIDELREVDDE